MQTDYDLKIINNCLRIQCKTKRNADAFGTWELASRLLHSLVFDVGQNRWVSSPRMDAAVLGWPKSIFWVRDGETTFTGRLAVGVSREDNDLNVLLRDLSNALAALGESPHRFSIIFEGQRIDYSFSQDRRRALVALCVLYDLQPQTRDALEVPTSEPRYTDWPLPEPGSKTYGDPSKTVDALRNRGFPRQTDVATPGEAKLLTERVQVAGGRRQETYRLIDRHQDSDLEKHRSQIKATWQRDLYSEAGYRCNFCTREFRDSPKHLAPDHRVPAIVEADTLTESNFREKLQTLCRNCNQLKRELCKQCPFGRACRQCPWAYPEQFWLRPETIQLLIERAREAKLSVDEFARRIR